MLSRYLQQLSERQSAALREHFITAPLASSIRSATSPGQVMLLLLSIVIMACYAATVYLGVVIFVQHVLLASNLFERLLNTLIAAMFLLFGWIARPYTPPSQDIALTPEQAPHFFALLQEISQRLNAPMPQKVYITEDFNAFIGREGLRRSLALTIGLPLFYALEPAERVALLAHEFAHVVSGDLTRTFWVGSAQYVLWRSYDAWYPSRKEPFLIRLFKYVLCLPLLGFIWCFQALAGQQSQAAEYRADLLSAQVAGSDNMRQLLEKSHTRHLFDHVIQKQYSNPEHPNAFVALRHVWAQQTETQLERQRQEVRQQRLRLDASHPPTTDRVEVMQAHAQPPQVTLSPEQAAQIDAELEPLIRPMQERAYARYRERYG